MDTDILWAAVDTRRRYLVDLFETLTPQQWDTASLCAGWTVRDVAGHLTMLDMSTLDIVRLALRHPGSTNRLIHKGSQEIASRHSTEELVAKIRALIGSRRTFPGLGGMEALLDLHAHTLDVTLPLGIDPNCRPTNWPRAPTTSSATPAAGTARSSPTCPSTASPCARPTRTGPMAPDRRRAVACRTSTSSSPAAEPGSTASPDLAWRPCATEAQRDSAGRPVSRTR